ncbi:response regulator transcription factor [Sedimenticola selenatireducens]|uniref:response regulator transcription factor n=2 Tax=Sedimenticola selenatireducens TaxID=191960 RepID=UPI002AAB2C9B|nr:response regulator transcription factor [Sedimenticola selenatireducens]
MSIGRILIADDHAMIREGIRAILADEQDLEIVGEAVNGHEAIHNTNLFQPSIILMDLNMPHINGTEAIRAIKRRHPKVKIIVLTVHKAEEFVRSTLDAGADAYILKDDTRLELISAIRHVQNGRSYLSPCVSSMVVTGYLGRNDSSTQQASWEVLTTREREVMKLVAEGFKNKQIGSYLSISLKTVEKHRSNLMKKLDLHSASAITAYAMDNNLLVN